MSKKKNRKRKHFDPYREDFHHNLFTRASWSKGWAKLLREHPYCGEYIPQMTLHSLIHREVKCVPVPDGAYCHMAYEAIESWLEAGYIHMNDTPEQKLETLIKCFKANSPKTAKALENQLKIVREFYESRP